jgi:hypothetical protein
MSPQNLINVYNQNPTLQSQYTLQQYLDLFGGSSTGTTTTTPTTTTTTATTAGLPAVTQPIINYNQGDGKGDDDDTTTGTNPGGKFDLATFAKAAGFAFNPIGAILGLLGTKAYQNYKDRQTLKDIETKTTPGVINDPNTVGGSSRDSKSGGSFGSSVNDAGSFSDYS